MNPCFEYYLDTYCDEVGSESNYAARARRAFNKGQVTYRDFLQPEVLAEKLGAVHHGDHNALFRYYQFVQDGQTIGQDTESNEKLKKKVAQLSLRSTSLQQNKLLADLWDRRAVCVLIKELRIRLDTLQDEYSELENADRHLALEPLVLLQLQMRGVVMTKKQCSQFVRKEHVPDAIVELDLESMKKEPTFFYAPNNIYLNFSVRKKGKEKIFYVKPVKILEVDGGLRILMNKLIPELENPKGFQGANVKQNVQHFLRTKVGVRDECVDIVLGYGVSNSWDKRAKALFLTYCSGEKNELNVSEIERYSTQLKQHFVKSNDKNYNIMHVMEKCLHDRKALREFLNPGIDNTPGLVPGNSQQESAGGKPPELL